MARIQRNHLSPCLILDVVNTQVRIVSRGV
nr:MAG TPA: hypothetical protein [Caudoviricetes sp.]DAP33894.1 MAG TPA: hypothetical protein [Caudoviricetes sp.]